MSRRAAAAWRAVTAAEVPAELGVPGSGRRFRPFPWPLLVAVGAVAGGVVPVTVSLGMVAVGISRMSDDEWQRGASPAQRQLLVDV